MRATMRLAVIAGCAAAILASNAPGQLATPPPAAPGQSPSSDNTPRSAASVPQSPSIESRPALRDAKVIERETIERMLNDSAWPRRAIAILRLERFGCDESCKLIEQRLRDPVWQVRAFAVRTLARRRIPAGETWFTDESEPRVIRAILRHLYAIDIERLGRGVRFLSRSSNLDDKLLAAEIGAASGDAELHAVARDAAKQVILRMERAQAGPFTPRLAAITGEREARRDYQWNTWLLKTGRRFNVQPAYSIEPGEQPLEPSRLGKLDVDAFVALEDYMAKLSQRHLDLAICLDCTASMSGEIAAAQAGADDMMLFVGDMVASLHVGLVAYRDRRDAFETRGWNFTADVASIRAALWQLSAEGGGDTPESVYAALKMAMSQFTWRPDSVKTLVLIGDAPPHVGQGELCVKAVEDARATAQLTVHVIQAEGEEVKHFPEIAAAGGGQCVSLEDDDLLMAEITGLTLGDHYEPEFREFFNIYLELCR